MRDYTSTKGLINANCCQAIRGCRFSSVGQDAEFKQNRNPRPDITGRDPLIDLLGHFFCNHINPADTLKNPKVPNSCQTCHKHKNEDLDKLQAQWEKLAKLPKPVAKAIDPIGYKYTR